MAFQTLSTRAAALLLVLSVSGSSAVAQTAIKPPKNRYTPEQDVKLGREAAAEIRQQYPVIENEEIARYLTKLGDRLVAVARAVFKHGRVWRDEGQFA
jgi:predicted Zn-dependent protease